MYLNKHLSHTSDVTQIVLNTRCVPHCDTQSNKAASVHCWGTEGVITASAGSTHTIRLISVYIPSLASGHDGGEPRVELISCPPSFLHKQQIVQLCRVHLVLRLSLMRICVCVFSIFSYRGADVLGLAGKEVLGHRQAGDQRTHSHTWWLMSLKRTLTPAWTLTDNRHLSLQHWPQSHLSLTKTRCVFSSDLTNTLNVLPSSIKHFETCILYTRFIYFLAVFFTVFHCCFSWCALQPP